MRSSNVKIIKALLKLNGENDSLDKLGEECIELGLAIIQFKCPTKTDKSKRLDDILKEIADVKIELRKSEIYLSRKKINKYVNFKLQKKSKKYLNGVTNK